MWNCGKKRVKALNIRVQDLLHGGNLDNHPGIINPYAKDPCRCERQRLWAYNFTRVASRTCIKEKLFTLDMPYQKPNSLALAE